MSHLRHYRLSVHHKMRCEEGTTETKTKVLSLSRDTEVKFFKKKVSLKSNKILRSLKLILQSTEKIFVFRGKKTSKDEWEIGFIIEESRSLKVNEANNGNNSFVIFTVL